MFPIMILSGPLALPFLFTMIITPIIAGGEIIAAGEDGIAGITGIPGEGTDSVTAVHGDITTPGIIIITTGAITTTTIISIITTFIMVVIMGITMVLISTARLHGVEVIPTIR
ncbi:MAG: hypothetical protein DWQ02_27555 [Bacteroidetes bacterium]|nr:MAG: hypothetical protein DWQ02_27555 [Bacteroidota bacterium]